MTDEMGAVLREISALLRRIAEQNELQVRQRSEVEERGKVRLQAITAKMEEARQARPDFAKTREEMAKRMEQSRTIATQQRQEDVRFRERLLAELERHNHLLEALIEKMGR
jgi:hypothetical protein